MSYIPKYILKRMVPDDAVKNTATGWEIEVTNVISPLTVDQIPDNVMDLFSFKVDEKEMDKNKMSLRYEDKVVSMKNPKDALGVTIPVGGKIHIVAEDKPLPAGMHKFEINIQIDNPINIALEREVKGGAAAAPAKAVVPAKPEAAEKPAKKAAKKAAKK